MTAYRVVRLKQEAPGCECAERLKANELKYKRGHIRYLDYLSRMRFIETSHDLGDCVEGPVL